MVLYNLQSQRHKARAKSVVPERCCGLSAGDKRRNRAGGKAARSAPENFPPSAIRNKRGRLMTRYRFGPFRLDKEQLMLSVGEAPIALGPKVVETLLALIEQPGEVLTKPQLLARVWPEGFVEEANLAQNIYVIRKALRVHWDADA